MYENHLCFCWYTHLISTILLKMKFLYWNLYHRIKVTNYTQYLKLDKSFWLICGMILDSILTLARISVCIFFSTWLAMLVACSWYSFVYCCLKAYRDTVQKTSWMKSCCQRSIYIPWNHNIYLMVHPIYSSYSNPTFILLISSLVTYLMIVTWLYLPF